MATTQPTLQLNAVILQLSSDPFLSLYSSAPSYLVQEITEEAKRAGFQVFCLGEGRGAVDDRQARKGLAARKFILSDC
jgi:hypothetical protein